MIGSHRLTLFLASTALTISLGYGVTDDQDLIVTPKQGQILEKFTDRMRPVLTQEYMTKPIFLLRWLRAANFNVETAERMLMNNLKWRRDNNIDNINNEDWSFFEEEFAYSVDTFDKTGRPIITIDSGKWDVRQAVLSGQRPRLVRWMVKMMEDATKLVRMQQARGVNVTRWGMIYNLGYFNLVQSGCLQCLTVYTEFVQNYEKYYPNHASTITLVNTPGIFDVILRAIRPAMSPASRDTLQVYGTNKPQWQQALLKDIPKNQLPVEYGGTRRRKHFDE